MSLAAMILIESATLVFVSGNYYLSTLCAVLALIAIPHRLWFTSRTGAFAVGGVLVLLATGLRIAGIQSASVPRDLIFGAAMFMGFAADLSLGAQTALLYYKPAAGNNRGALPYPYAFIALGVVVMVGAGTLLAINAVQLRYQVAVVCFLPALLAAGALMCHGPVHGAWWKPKLFLIQVAALLPCLALGILGNHLLATYGNRVDDLLTRIGLNNVQPSRLGFSTTARLDSVSRIRSMEEKTVLRIYADAPPGYLRARAYDTYSERNWLTSPGQTKLTPVPQSKEGSGRLRYGLETQEATAGAMLEVWQDASLNEALFVPWETVSVRFAGDSLAMDIHGALIPRNPDTTVPVGVERIGDKSPEALSPGLREKLLTVPDSLDPQVREQVKSLFDEDADVPAKCLAVERYFHENFAYQLGITIPAGIDPLNYFLIERPAAHCEYFAAGAVVLLRLLGVPCRYVTGFVAVEQNPYGGYWIARHRDAHAWVEAYDEKLGWRIVEPTPASGMPDVSKNPSWVYFKDYVAQRWRELRMALSAHALREQLAKWLGGYSQGIGIALLLLLGGLAGIAITHRLRPRKRPHRKASVPPSPEIKTMRILLKKQDAMTRREGFVRAPQETLHAFAMRIECGSGTYQRIAVWYRRYANLRYSADINMEKVEDLKHGEPNRRGMQ